MKTLRSLLAGSAASLAVATAAHSADLPVKAKPIQYVKICTLHGNGFYYIPGSDTCLRIGGYVRADYSYNVRANVPEYSGDAGANDRNPNRHPFTSRHLLNWQADARTQTAHGELRTYTSVQIENSFTFPTNDVGNVDLTLQRAFIEWAGFTFGHTVSFADVPGQISESGIRSLHQPQTESQTGRIGINQLAYTWRLAEGVRFSIGADERRARAIWNATNSSIRIGGNPASSRTGQSEPSPLAALRIEGPWGKAAVAGIAQRNRAGYYTGGPGCAAGAQSSTTECSHPDDRWAWGIRGGVEIGLPMLGPGDRFVASAYYSEGATRLAAQPTQPPSVFGTDRTVAFGFLADAVYVNAVNGAPGQLQQTTARSVNGGYEHYWTPNVSTAWYGGYAAVSYNDTVIDNRWFCSVAQVQTVPATRRCDPGFALYHIGTVSNWFPAPGFRLAIDLLHTGTRTAMAGAITLGQARGLRPTGAYTAKDLGVTSVMFRIQRDWAADRGERN